MLVSCGIHVSSDPDTVVGQKRGRTIGSLGSDIRFSLAWGLCKRAGSLFLALFLVFFLHIS